MPVGNRATFFNSAPANRTPDTTATPGANRNVQLIHFQAGAGSYNITNTGVLNNGDLSWFPNADAKVLQIDSGVTASQTISVKRVQIRGNGSIINDSTTALLTISSDVISGTTGSKTFTFGGVGNTLYSGPVGTPNTNRTEGVTKTGTGTVTFAGRNIYTLDTLVSAGTLAVNGSLVAYVTTDPTTLVTTVESPASDVFVTPTGTSAMLAGTGRIDGEVTVGAASLTSLQSAVLSPGDVSTPVGTLTINNDVTFLNSGVLDVQISNNQTDLLAITGDLNLAGAFDTLNVAATGTQTLSRYVFATYTGTLNGTFDDVNITGLSGASLDVSQPGQLAVVIPEPASLASVALVAGGLGLRRRRGR